jgi:hypothetical protein
MIGYRWLKPVHTRDGRTVIARPHEATFNGLHNSAKARTLIVLYHLKHKLSDTRGLTLKQLAITSGVSYSTLKSSLGDWYMWKYVKRRVIEGTTRPMFSYVIGQRGEHFVENRIPRNRLQDYITEISAYRQAYIPTTRTNIHVVDKPI